MRARLGLTVGLVAALVGSAIFPIVSARADSSISIVDYGFQPSTITVQVGTKVVWTNSGNDSHASTSDAGSAEVWNINTPNHGDSGSHTFNRVGVFTYHCSVHPFMQGTITVVASDGSTSTPLPTKTPFVAVPTATMAPTRPPTSLPVGTPATTATKMPTVAVRPTLAVATAGATPTRTVTTTRPSLALSASGSLRAGRTANLTLTVRNRSTGRPVPSAGIKLSGRAVGIKHSLSTSTGRLGKATFSLLHPTRAGKIHVTASKSGWRGASLDVRVKR